MAEISLVQCFLSRRDSEAVHTLFKAEISTEKRPAARRSSTNESVYVLCVSTQPHLDLWMSQMFRDAHSSSSERGINTEVWRLKSNHGCKAMLLDPSCYWIRYWFMFLFLLSTEELTGCVDLSHWLENVFYIWIFNHYPQPGTVAPLLFCRYSARRWNKGTIISLDFFLMMCLMARWPEYSLGCLTSVYTWWCSDKDLLSMVPKHNSGNVYIFRRCVCVCVYGHVRKHIFKRQIFTLNQF